jgi:EpsI family protein
VPALPAAAEGWSGPRAPTLPWRPRYSGATDERMARYETDGGAVQLAMLSYTAQVQGSELVNSENVPYSGEWTLVAQARARTPDAAGGSHAVQATRLHGAGGNLLVWHWYAIGTRATASEALAKLYQLSAALRGSAVRAVLIAVATPEEPDADAAARRLEAFVRAHAGALAMCAGEAHAGCAG